MSVCAMREAEFEAAIRALQSIRRPSEISWRRDGKELAFTTRPLVRDKGRAFDSQIWRMNLGEAPVCISDGRHYDAMPLFSPVDDRLAFASDRAEAGRLALYVQEGSATRRLDCGGGTVESASWAADGSALYALTADKGLDGNPNLGASRIWWGEAADPDISIPRGAQRRLMRIDPRGGAAREAGPEKLNVWEFAIVDARRALVLASEDNSERGWYRAQILLVDMETRAWRALYKTQWQVQSIAVKDGHAAFVEGWASDRSLVAGEIRAVDLATGTVQTIAPEISDACWVAWRDASSLWFGGWRETGCIYGAVTLDSKVEWMEREEAVVGPTLYSAGVSPQPGGGGIAAIREAVGEPSELVFRAGPKAKWEALTHFNEGVAAASGNSYPEVKEVEWKSADGLAIRGLLLVPPGRTTPSPLVTLIHGGPTLAYRKSFDPGGGLALAAAGYAVFMANYRGSTGRGQNFTRMNLGDPAGKEFDDIESGVKHLIAQGVADPKRIAVAGQSYGGYLTAWAVVKSSLFRAGAMLYGITDLISCQHDCNNGFPELIIGEPLNAGTARGLYAERSPLVHVSSRAAPTLILHGEEDHCVPLGQAREFHRALVDHGVATELVVYPREGHGFRERAHHRDVWRRVAAWFEKYLA